jgi:hypothetical protein
VALTSNLSYIYSVFSGALAVHDHIREAKIMLSAFSDFSLTGVLLLFTSLNIDDWLGSEDGSRKPNIHLLTVTFFTCIFFASMQDIAVDGWSLTMLQK